MVIRNKLLLAAIVVFAWIVADASPSHAGASNAAILVVLDNSAALQQHDEAEEYKKRIAFHLTEMRKRRGLKHARVRIIGTNDPRTLWYGTPAQLFRNGATLLPKLGIVENGCSDLVRALEVVRRNLELDQSKHVLVLIFSSLLHSGTPCNDVTIELPQPVPAGVDLSMLAKSSIKVRFFWAHHVQLPLWLAAIEEAGLTDAKIYDVETSKTILRSGLDDK